MLKHTVTAIALIMMLGGCSSTLIDSYIESIHDAGPACPNVHPYTPRELRCVSIRVTVAQPSMSESITMIRTLLAQDH